MPNSLVRSLAKKYSLNVKDVESKWKKAKVVATSASKGDDYGYIVGILKKMLNEEALGKSLLRMDPRELTTEVMDTKIKVSDMGRSDGYDQSYQAVTPQGTDIQIGIDTNPRKFTTATGTERPSINRMVSRVTFSTWDETADEWVDDRSPKDDPLAVFSAVKIAIDTFITRYKPQVLRMDSIASDKRRVALYRRMFINETRKRGGALYVKDSSLGGLRIVSYFYFTEEPRSQLDPGLYERIL